MRERTEGLTMNNSPKAVMAQCPTCKRVLHHETDGRSRDDDGRRCSEPAGTTYAIYYRSGTPRSMS